MIIRNARKSANHRPGAAAFEVAIVLPILAILLIGTMFGGLRISRYQWISAMARDGARWASVHGPTYSSESGKGYITSTDVLNAIKSRMTDSSGNPMNIFDLTALTCTLSPSPLTSSSTKVTVTLTYQEAAQVYFPASSISSTSVMPITY